MVIAAFYVMTADVSAEDTTVTENEIEDAVSNIDHVDRRITISNSKASSPVVAVGTDGETHMAWVDGEIGSQSVCWKRSNDSLSTFTSDKIITTSFYSISDLSILLLDGPFGMAVAFEGRSSAGSMTTVYFLFSENGDEWSATYAVSEGDSPSLCGDGEIAFLGMNAVLEGRRRFCLLSLQMQEGAVNATMLAALPLAAVDGDILFHEGLIDLALFDGGSGSILFLQLSENGTVITSPSRVGGAQGAKDFELLVTDGTERLMFVDGGTIKLARRLGDPVDWAICTPLQSNDTISEASMIVTDGSIRIAYAVETSDRSGVYDLECDLQGRVKRDAEIISTPGLGSSAPVVFVTAPGVISCVYAEEHYDSQELFLKQDLDFVIPDIPRLKKYIEALDPIMFSEGNVSIQKLMDKLDKVIAQLEEKSEATALTEALSLRTSLATYFVYAPYADLGGIEEVKNKIKKNLDTIDDPSDGFTVMSNIIPDPVPGDTTVYFSRLSAVTNTTAEAVWILSDGIAVSGYILWGNSPTNLSNRLNGSLVYTPHTLSTTFAANITGLSENTTYYASCHVITGTYDLESYYPSPFRTYPGTIYLHSISVSTYSGSAIITWVTDCNTTSQVEYGTSSSYGNVVSDSSLTTAHSITIDNLATSTLYHYRVSSTYSVTGFSLSSVSGDRSFTSAPITISISALSATLTDLNAVRIIWTTNIAASSTVYYGTTTSYGSTASGNTGTSHTVNINGLAASTVYHYKVKSVSSTNPNNYAISTDHTFTTKNVGDAGLNVDAGDSLSTASLLSPGSYFGYLDASLDTNDYYSLPLFSGETVKLVLDVPSNFDYQLYLYNPSGTLAASSTNGVGVDENLQYTINVNGAWKVRAFHQSGSGQGMYALDVQVLGGYDRYSLDVGASGDNDVLAHTPGLALLDGTGWYAVSGGKRETSVNGSFLLNIYDGTYQSSTYYEMSIAYTSSADVDVSVLIGDAWATVATLPGRSTAWTYSFVLKSDLLSDSSATLFASNVRLRFDHQVIVDSIDVMPVAYASDFFGGTPNYPGVMLENNWQIGSAVVNGTTYATLIVSLPRTDLTYFLELVNMDSCSGIGVQQWDGSAYDSIGTLESWGTSAVIQLAPAYYYDISSSTPGMNLRLRLTAPLVNLSRAILWTSQSRTDVGVSGDTDASAHTPGISLLGNSEWGSMTVLDSRTVRRTTQGSYANFYLNGAQSDTSYVVSITYKATSGTAILQQYRGSAYGGYLSLGNLIVDGQWHTTSYITSPANVYDNIAGGEVDLIFEITSYNSVAIDSISVCRDSDGDTYSDAYEALRMTIADVGTHLHDLNPFSADTDSDGLNDNVEVSTYGTDPCDPDTDSDGLLDGSERYSYTWSTDDSYLIPDNNTVLIIDLSLPAIQGGTSSISSLCLVLGIMHGAQHQLEIKIAKGTGTQKVIKAANTGSGANYFVLKNLFTMTSPYSASDLSTANVWHIYVRDVTAGTQGRVEYARLQVNGTTNALVADSDSDGILDGEEVEFGVDGWCTNPRSADSDSDGVTDWNEIHGNTLCGTLTDPTRNDTDDDGCPDN
ncbi:MAG: hypothetical protein NT131_02335, partial [Methanomassiliicoccales archaeon]|nr:hypothetical protein [Methanomassiliicoccales archaeon]